MLTAYATGKKKAQESAGTISKTGPGRQKQPLGELDSMVKWSRYLESVTAQRQPWQWKLLCIQDGELLPDKLIPPLMRKTPVDPVQIHVPLSADHRLLTVIHLNVFRATVTNLAILSLLDRMPSECAEAVQRMAPFAKPDKSADVPASLRPTALQQTVKHDVYIDVIPCPAMRDNLIRNLADLDEDDLCDDLMGCMFEGFDGPEKRGFIAWNDPWDVDGWEVTEGFVRKWGFLLAGCAGMMKATNRWRRLRGERPLVLERLHDPMLRHAPRPYKKRNKDRHPDPQTLPAR